jgi:hypothetical protein
MTFETFKLSELRLDENNYRIGRVGSQREAILALIADQKQKLVNLAKDILAEEGVSPGEPIWVSRAASGGYTVIEGRVTALKLMDNPALADGTEVEKEFRLLGQQFAQKPIRELTAYVYPKYDDAAPWRRRRHLPTDSGVGLERWNHLAKARALRDHGEGARRSLAVFEYLDDGSEYWMATADALDTKWTTVERVLNTSALKEDLGLIIDPKTGAISPENGDEVAARKLLRTILGAMAATDFDFRDIEKVGDRKTFLTRFAGMSVKGRPLAAPKGSRLPQRPAAPLGPPPARQRVRLINETRATLAPKSGPKVFPVAGRRLHKIYDECRKIKVADNENAAALLLRVFIELSTEALLAEKNVAIPSAFGKKNAKRWDDIGIPLSAKVQQALDFLNPGPKKSKDFQNIRVALDSQSHGVASINTLHGYFHNRDFMPDANNITKAWDVWEQYLRAVHEAR